MHNLSSYIHEIVNNGFHEVRDAHIISFYTVSSDHYLESEKKNRYLYEISVDRSLMEVPKEVIVGGLAHEIAHISMELRRNFIINTIDTLLCMVPFYSTFDERRTDRLVIQRGFGSELLSFIEYCNETRENYNRLDGLTEKEIRKILEKK